MPERTVVRNAAAGPLGHHAVAPGLQRGQAAQQLPANAAGEVPARSGALWARRLLARRLPRLTFMHVEISKARLARNEARRARLRFKVAMLRHRMVLLRSVAVRAQIRARKQLFMSQAQHSILPGKSGSEC